jgi:hypothetical protein
MQKTTTALSNRNVGMMEKWNTAFKRCEQYNIIPPTIPLFQNSIIPLIGMALKVQLSPKAHLCCAQKETD